MRRIIALFSCVLVILRLTLVGAGCGSSSSRFAVYTDIHESKGKFGGRVYASLKFGSTWTSWSRLDNSNCNDYTGNGYDYFNDFDSILKSKGTYPNAVKFDICTPGDHWHFDAIIINDRKWVSFSDVLGIHDCLVGCQQKDWIGRCVVYDYYEMKTSKKECKEVVFGLSNQYLEREPLQSNIGFDSYCPNVSDVDIMPDNRMFTALIWIIAGLVIVNLICMSICVYKKNIKKKVAIYKSVSMDTDTDVEA